MNHLPSNYCTHFIDSFVNREAIHSKQISVLKSMDFLAVSQISEWVEKSQKYFIPSIQKIDKSNSLTDEVKGLRASDLDLPFPIISVEYKTDSSEVCTEDESDPLWRTEKGKRIALILSIPPKGSKRDAVEFRKSCFFQSLEPSLWSEMDEHGGMAMFSLRFEDVENSWSIALSLFSISRPHSQKSDGPIDWHCFAPALLGTYARLSQQHSHQNVQQAMRKDVEQDVLACIRFIRLMSCSNIQTVPVECSGLEKLNKRRDAAKKCPLFPYRTLSVSGPKGSSALEDIFGGVLKFESDKKESLFFFI